MAYNDDPPRSPKWRVSILTLAASITVASCSPRSQLFGTWREPEGPPGPYARVVAIALTQNENTRRIAEDEFARRLPENTEGFKSYELIPTEDEDEVVARLRAEDIDGAAVLRLVEEQNSVAYDPGYLSTEIAVRVETAFYSVKDAKLVWTGYSELNPQIGARGHRRRHASRRGGAPSRANHSLRFGHRRSEP